VVAVAVAVAVFASDAAAAAADYSKSVVSVAAASTVIISEQFSAAAAAAASASISLFRQTIFAPHVARLQLAALNTRGVVQLGSAEKAAARRMPLPSQIPNGKRKRGGTAPAAPPKQAD